MAHSTSFCFITAMTASRTLRQLLLLLSLSLICCYAKYDPRDPLKHVPGDRPRHQRAHNLHRPPYQGYDWYRNYPMSEEAAIEQTDGDGDGDKENSR